MKQPADEKIGVVPESPPFCLNKLSLLLFLGHEQPDLMPSLIPSHISQTTLQTRKGSHVSVSSHGPPTPEVHLRTASPL